MMLFFLYMATCIVEIVDHMTYFILNEELCCEIFFVS